MTAPSIETLATLARHSGTCKVCHGRIFYADPIQRVDGRWVHEECVPFEAVLAPSLVDLAATSRV